MERLALIFVGLLVLSVVFGLIETAFPGNPRQPRWRGRRGFKTDVTYWFMTPLFTRSLSNLGLVLVLALIYQQAPAELLAMMNERDTLLARQPLWLQIVEMLVIGDFVGYWVHRAFHRRPLWSLHAVHHSSEDLDWLSSLRFHPFNDWIARWIQACALMLLGFSPAGLIAYVPFLSMLAVLQHANVTWDFGPLRTVIASPRFHRWHHTSQAEGLDKNFAALLPIYDIVFGTWYMPEGRVAQTFGLHGDTVPDSYVGQLLYPFRRGASFPGGVLAAAKHTDVKTPPAP